MGLHESLPQNNKKYKVRKKERDYRLRYLVNTRKCPNLLSQNIILNQTTKMFTTFGALLMPVILTLRRQSQKDCKFKASLGHTAKPCPKTKQKTTSSWQTDYRAVNPFPGDWQCLFPTTLETQQGGSTLSRPMNPECMREFSL